MTHLRNFFRFWYGFIIGDDWMTAAGVVIALVVTAVIAHRVASAWWVMPVTVRSTAGDLSLEGNAGAEIGKVRGTAG